MAALPPRGSGHRRLGAYTSAVRIYRLDPAALEIRTVAGPSSVLQCVFIGGPCTVASHVRHVQVVCPPPWPRQG